MERPWYRSFNWVMALGALALSLAGVVFIGSADLHSPDAAGEWRKQVVYILIGLLVMATCAAIDYHKWQRWSFGLYIANLLLLGLVMVGGRSALGAQRWITLGAVQFQPSEPAKLILAICVAALLARVAVVGWREIGMTVCAVAVPALLILKQPDLGTTLVIFAIVTAELFFGVASLRQFLVYALGAFAGAALVVGTNVVLKPFQRDRLLVFLHPDADPQGAGWNLNQSKIAVGSGEWFGKGLYHGTQTQLNFVPEHSRDFIFTVVGEETGYVGSLCLIGLYALVLFGAVRAMLAARDRFGVLLAAGLIAMFAFHITVNIGMTVGIMPITGIPLPFMSYGGTAILTDFAAVGVLLNIYVQRDKLVF
ncbi:MAG: rod shape-determining protein RodA [Candidatus Eremiobacteraeota bacterium]|nr:rod shape-determining protein RodA [Candidatus Eremiobacteraeota bacterium]